MDVLRSEIANQQQQQQLQQQQQSATSSFYKSLSFSSSKLGNNHHNHHHQQRSASGSESLLLQRRWSINSLQRGMLSLGGNNNNDSHRGGCVHTAWYLVHVSKSLFGSHSHSTSTNSVESRSVATGSQQKGGRLLSQNQSMKNRGGREEKHSFVAALSSKGPREDVHTPQLRVTLTVVPTDTTDSTSNTDSTR
jgi:hypothetical protein